MNSPSPSPFCPHLVTKLGGRSRILYSPHWTRQGVVTTLSHLPHNKYSLLAIELQKWAFSPPHAGLGCKLQHIGNVDVLLMPRIGIRRPPWRGLPASPAHPHPPVPDDPEYVRLVPIVEDCAKHPLSEGGSY